MKIALELISAFIIVITFGFVFQTPKRSIWLLGITGVISWSGFLIAKNLTNNLIISSFIASLLVGLCGESFARIMKLPVTIFVICGIIPLVPGVPAYNTMLYLIKGDYLKGVELGINTIMIAGAIAFAIAIVSTLAGFYSQFQHNKKGQT